jgi:hypothetical protein
MLKNRIEEQSVSLAELPEIHSFLDAFFLSRIGIRILIGQHVSLHEEQRDGYIGAINTQCDPYHLAQQSISYVPRACQWLYCIACMASAKDASPVPFALHGDGCMGAGDMQSARPASKWLHWGHHHAMQGT